MPEPSNTYKLSVQCVQDSERWFGDTISVDKAVPHHALALAGEVGEFCNLVKKLQRGSLNIDDAQTRFNLYMELTDVYVYLLNLAGLLHVDLEQSYMVVRAKNEKRFTRERDERDLARLRTAPESSEGQSE